jgi:hypothetical protein
LKGVLAHNERPSKKRISVKRLKILIAITFVLSIMSALKLILQDLALADIA